MTALSKRLKISYALGSTAEAIAITATTSFLLLFYNQVKGLPAAHVGLALAAGLIVNAVFDPLVGSWSDRTRSKWGRRHPFLFASILPAALLFWAVFNPPDIGELGQLIWLALANTMLLQAMTLYHTPHLALGGELSEDYLERTSVMAYNSFFLWIGDTLGWLLSFRVFFAATEQFPNGALDPSRWPTFSITIALMILVMLSYSSWATRSRIPFLPQPAADTPRFGLRELFRDIGRALSNRNYVVLLVGLFFLSMMVGVRSGLWLYGATYFWRLTNDQISWFALGSFAGYLFAAFAVKPLHARLDKRWTGAGALLLYAIGPAIPLALGWLGILSADTPGLLPILIGFSILQHAPYSLMTTTLYSALADIADENELKHGLRQEGVLYATRTFFARVDQALGTALAGFVLTLIAFPEKATPGQVPEPVLMGLAAAFVLSTIPGLVAGIFYAMLRVTRGSYTATRAALDARALSTKGEAGSVESATVQKAPGTPA
ncbi:MFS transporter [Sandaracinobacteroides saxicola]|uniref:MFS transporter n=1 Tax=Sandaracinobacteroides saxicola TaxID=2759707 RepID=A0A7G5IEU4_9SPHN|nr:MFS transporter [Sandaracinobacteroides saxicola]QMW21886.1 MFS transporter [Sandaracinobacteroides saxicola]